MATIWAFFGNLCMSNWRFAILGSRLSERFWNKYLHLCSSAFKCGKKFPAFWLVEPGRFSDWQPFSPNLIQLWLSSQIERSIFTEVNIFKPNQEIKVIDLYPAQIPCGQKGILDLFGKLKQCLQILRILMSLKLFLDSTQENIVCQENKLMHSFPVF